MKFLEGNERAAELMEGRKGGIPGRRCMRKDTKRQLRESIGTRSFVDRIIGRLRSRARLFETLRIDEVEKTYFRIPERSCLWRGDLL
jgi:hypothetical protein